MKWIDLSAYGATLTFREMKHHKWFIVSPIDKLVKDALRIALISTIPPADLKLNGELLAFPVDGLSTKLLNSLPLSSLIEVTRDVAAFTGVPKDEKRILRNDTDQSSRDGESGAVPSATVVGRIGASGREDSQQPNGNNGSADIDTSAIATGGNVPQETASGELGETSSPRRNTAKSKAGNRTSLNPNHFFIGNEITRDAGFKPMERFNENLEAIKTLRELENGGELTADVQSVLAKFNGWGGLSAILSNGAQWRLDGWSKGAAESLQGIYGKPGLLSAAELDSARSATLSSHFTSPHVIDAVWTILKDSGFKGGRIAEPAAGIGNFLGRMPEDIVANSHITAVEKDALTGAMLKSLYPDANVHISGFEDIQAKNKFDLVISNVPFGDYSVYDKEYRYLNLNIHDYFAVKALDAAKPGGIVAIITSRYTMDKKDSFARKQMAQRGELVGAIRLPDNSQQSQAGVKVVTDILFFKRRDKPLAALPDASMYSWIGTSLYEGEQPEWMTEDADLSINDYFIENPSQVLGAMAYARGQNGIPLLGVSSDLPVSEWAEEIVNHAPIFSAAPFSLDDDTSDVKAGINPLDVESDYLVGSLIKVGEDVHVVVNDRGSESAGLTGVRLDRVMAMIAVKHEMNKVIHHQIDLNSTEDELKEAMSTLNRAYDAFTAKFGAINQPVNARLFVSDPEAGRLFALEHYDAETKEATKADIFSRRVISPQEVIESFDSDLDALNHVVAQYGGIDIKRIAKLTGHTESDVSGDLLEGRHIYINPETGKYDTASKYLSGNVREKLVFAKQALDDNPIMAVNMADLEAVKPIDVEFEDISIRPGAGWLDSGLYPQYLSERILGSKPDDYKAEMRYSDGQWYISYPKHFKHRTEATHEYGTRRMDMFTMLERIMNQREIVIKDSIKDDNGSVTVVNESETLIAQEKADLLTADFVNWLQEDAMRKTDVEETYNFKMNGFVAPKYKGDSMLFPGMSSAIVMRPHQKNAVMRSIQSGNMLAAHQVGTGKTYTMIAAAMEYKRLGLANKPIIIVPNHMLEQIHREGLQLYPNAKVLAVSNKDLNGDARKLFVGKVINNDWDFVVMTHSMFKRIGVDPEFERRFTANEIAILQSELAVMGDNGAPRYTLKSISKKIENKKASLLKMLDMKRDDGVTMNMLGVDFIAVDEAHNFKNLEISGGDYSLTMGGSDRAFDLYMKLNALKELRNDGRGALFSTGTPVSNNLLEIFNMQRYLQSETIYSMGVGNITSWSGSFMTPVTQWEPDASGSGFTLRTRRVLNNIPELMRTWRQVMDVVTSEDAGIKRPEALVHNVSAPMTMQQESIMEDLAGRAIDIRNGGIDPREDNILKIVSEGRQSALDPRLIDESADAPNPKSEITKIDMASDKIVEIYHETTADKGTQLVFIDMGTPGRIGFNVYDHLKALLIAKGVDEKEIAYIHDAKNDKQKGELFAKVRTGELRVFFGSTGKMGEGMNVQDRIAALHHIDPPWRPSDIEQRSGRMVRQGNMFENVGEYIYTTEGSFDLYMWNTLKVKADAFSRILSGDESLRVFDSQVNPSYADTVAITTNNPLIKNKMESESEVNKLEQLSTNFDRDKLRNKSEISYQETMIDESRYSIEKLGTLPTPELNDEGEVVWTFPNPDYIEAEEDEREDLAEFLTGNRQDMTKSLEKLRKKELVSLEEGVVVRLGEMEVTAYRRPNSLTTEWEMNGRYYHGTAAIDNQLLNKEESIEMHEASISRAEEKIAYFKSKLDAVNPYEENLKIAVSRLKEIDLAIENGAKEMTVKEESHDIKSLVSH